MTIVFLNEQSFLKFEKLFLEYKKKLPNQKKLSLQTSEIFPFNETKDKSFTILQNNKKNSKLLIDNVLSSNHEINKMVESLSKFTIKFNFLIFLFKKVKENEEKKKLIHNIQVN